MKIAVVAIIKTKKDKTMNKVVRNKIDKIVNENMNGQIDTVYKIKSILKTEYSDGEKHESEREHIWTNLDELKDRLKDILKDVSFDEHKHMIWLDGNRVKTYEDETGKITITYSVIEVIKVNKYA